MRPPIRRAVLGAVAAVAAFAAFAAFAAVAIAPVSVRAQASASSDGALFLLLPVGAQTVGMGQATVAERTGSEGIWSNPASIARQGKREAAIHHSETIAARGDIITLLVPKKSVGSFAASVNILDFGNQQITDPGGTPIGLVLPRNILFAGTFGAEVGRNLSLGVTYKRLQYRVDCSGQCANVSTFSATSSAVDFGAQYDISGDSPMRIGAAIRNIGTKLQVNDREQADPLPTRIEVGLSYQLGFLAKYISDVDVRAAADVIATKTADDPSARLGVDLTYQKTVHLRGGYIANDADGANAAIGFGLGTGRLLFDIARTFGGLSEDAGKTPTYVSLRFVF
ncbi:MAG: PorV/PorQ family protein [Gemmatimonadaceae bacterium]|nr:PorV/PorQ family protein [Gemmatimonadaceae bacterium]